MSALLVGYGSSDEEGVEEDVGVERPAKKPRLEAEPSPQDAKAVAGGRRDETSRRDEADLTNGPAPTPTEPSSTPQLASAPFAPFPEPHVAPIGPAAGPRPGPPAAPSPEDDPRGQPDPPASPYTTERLRVRAATMPPIPNFDIPDAPPPPPPDSGEAAVLASTTAKFERFLALKQQGVHFNERLMQSSSLRNPSLLPKLMEFAGIGLEDSYASTLGEEVGGVPVKWPEECYVEGLMGANARREERRAAEKDRVEFVPAAGKRGASSAKSTPGGQKR